MIKVNLLQSAFDTQGLTQVRAVRLAINMALGRRLDERLPVFDDAMKQGRIATINPSSGHGTSYFKRTLPATPSDDALVTLESLRQWGADTGLFEFGIRAKGGTGRGASAEAKQDATADRLPDDEGVTADIEQDPSNAPEIKAREHSGYWSAVARDFGAPNWKYWLDLRSWTPREAACLIFELNPDRYEQVASNIYPQPRGLIVEIVSIERKGVREQQAGQLCERPSPDEWAKWAQGNGFALPDKWHSLNDAAKVGAGGTATIKESETKNWILVIQAEAARRWKILRDVGANPTKNNIKNDLAKWCRESDVVTDGGINPNAEYIYRHVLQKWTPPKG